MDNTSFVKQLRCTHDIIDSIDEGQIRSNHNRVYASLKPIRVINIRFVPEAVKTLVRPLLEITDSQCYNHFKAVPSSDIVMSKVISDCVRLVPVKFKKSSGK